MQIQSDDWFKYIWKGEALEYIYREREKNTLFVFFLIDKIQHVMPHQGIFPIYLAWLNQRLRNFNGLFLLLQVPSFDQRLKDNTSHHK